jgi:hypothetical protein
MPIARPAGLREDSSANRVSDQRPHQPAAAATSQSPIDHRAAGLIAIAALCVVVSGCGGEHSIGLSRHQLVRRAQAICLREQSAVGAMLPPSPQAGLDGAASYFEQSAAIAKARTDELKALKVRPAVRLTRQWKRVIAAEAAFTARMRSLQAAAASHDLRRLELVQADHGPEQALIRSATKLRVPLCAP